MIRAENVHVTFRRGLFKNRIKALDGFCLSVEEGDIFALLGPNGAGKSTAMYCFLGLIQPDYGDVEVLGQHPSPGSDIFKEAGYLPEEPHYHLYLTVEEAVRYYASLYGNGIDRKRVLDAIDRVGLMEFRDLGLRKCSKGMKQKVGIAQCLINNPRVLFLDEPTRGLDPLTVKDLRDILVEMNRNGMTIVLNSHVLSEIEMICNRVAIMHKGKVIAQDTLEELVGTDFNTYSVRFDADGHVPDYVHVTFRTHDSVKGDLPAARLAEFLLFLEETGNRLYDCSLKRDTLEDVFYRIMEERK